MRIKESAGDHDWQQVGWYIHDACGNEQRPSAVKAIWLAHMQSSVAVQATFALLCALPELATLVAG